MSERMILKMMADLNNQEVTEEMVRWMHSKGLDR
ncbi:unknown [Sutterella sp. CAG:351]|nr:unknown [Sutterella sp. CAG:351]